MPPELRVCFLSWFLLVVLCQPAQPPPRRVGPHSAVVGGPASPMGLSLGPQDPAQAWVKDQKEGCLAIPGAP